MRPTIGRTVHFYPAQEVGQGAGPFAAIVTKVGEDSPGVLLPSLSLTVFPGGEIQHLVQVPYSPGPALYGRWQWPERGPTPAAAPSPETGIAAVPKKCSRCGSTGAWTCGIRCAYEDLTAAIEARDREVVEACAVEAEKSAHQLSCGHPLCTAERCAAAGIRHYLTRWGDVE
jgi:hypothetical protein